MNIPWAEPWLESISQTIQSAQFYFNPYSLPFLGAAIFILFFGSYIFSRGGAFLLRFSFLTVCVSFFLWLGGTFITYSAGNENCAMFGIYIVYSGVSFIMPSLCWYVAVWLNQVRKNKGYIILGFSLGLVFTVLIIKTNWIVYSLTKHFFGYHSRLSIPGGTKRSYPAANPFLDGIFHCRQSGLLRFSSLFRLTRLPGWWISSCDCL